MLPRRSYYTKSMRIGVLAIQGDFAAHQLRLHQLGVESIPVRKAEQLAQIEGLIIPGGESGAFLKLLGDDFFAALRIFVNSKPTFGTCAGAIMLATEVLGPAQPSLGAIDMTIRRNAYGRQIDSSIRTGKLASSTNNTLSEIEMVFIRAPKIERIGPGVQVLATEGGTAPDGQPDIVAVRQGSAMAATFHPELSSDSRVHQLFVALVQDYCKTGATETSK